MTIFREDFIFYRRELDRLFPEQAGRIVIANRLYSYWPEGIFADLLGQAPQVPLNPDYCEHIAEALNVLRRENLNFNGSFLPLYDGDSRVKAVHLALPLPPSYSARREYISSSVRDFVNLQTLFNEAALDRPVLACLYFYRAIARAADNLAREKAPEEETRNKTYEDMENGIRCDVYAALKAYEHFGERAIPVIETTADMRLSHVWQGGCEALSRPAVMDAIGKYKTAHAPGEEIQREIAAESARRMMPSKDEFDKVEALIARWESGETRRSAISDGLLMPGVSPRSWAGHQFSIERVFQDSRNELKDAARRAFLYDYKGFGLGQAARDAASRIKTCLGLG